MNESITTLLQATLPCYLVNNLTDNAEEQCKFIIDNDCLESEAKIDYAHLVYCDFGANLRYLAICTIVLLVIILFLSLGAVADEFLCPSLLAVAKNLRMSDSLAGVTLLAFGNGCTDIFASMAAASDGRPEMIVGELLGAGIFCTSIVAGLIFIHSDFKLATRPLLRDSMFYLLATYLVWLYCYAEAITFYGSLAFILIYIIYLIVALTGQAVHAKMRGNYALSDTREQCGMQQGKTVEDECEISWFEFSDGLGKRKIKLISQKTFDQPSEAHEKRSIFIPSDIQDKNRPLYFIEANGRTSIEVSNVTDKQNQKFMSPNKLTKSQDLESSSNRLTNDTHVGDLSRLPPTYGSFHSPDRRRNSSDSPSNEFCYRCARIGHLNDRFPSSLSSQSTSRTPSLRSMTLIPNDYSSTSSLFSCDCHPKIVERRQLENGCQKPGGHKVGVSNSMQDLSNEPYYEFLQKINPLASDGWRELSFLGKIAQILRAPLIFLATLTVPVVSYEKRNHNWCRLLQTLHCVTSPMVFMFTVCGEDKCDSLQIFGVQLRYFVLGGSLILALVVHETSSPNKPPSYHAAFAYAGFIMSVTWVYMLATEIISLLKTVGIMFSMSDTAVGLGILAWGNSLGDIVANLSLAEAGYPRMALGASIGAPLLNLLLGFGLSFTLYIEPGGRVPIAFSPTITLLCLTLTILLFLLMTSTLLPDEFSKKPFGYLLICGYGIYFVSAVCLEYKFVVF